MATLSASWTENQTGVDFDDTTPADTVTATADIDLAASGYVAVFCQIKIDWHASATDYADIYVYGSADSGTTEDSTALFSQRVTALDNDPEYISFIIRDVPYIAIAVENQSNQEIAELDLIYAGLQYTSA